VVDVLEYLGAGTVIIVDCGGAGKLTVRVSGDSGLTPGEGLGLRYTPENIHFFDAEGLAIR
jgi:multiple sugar transport system ATP-binding protein